jgi:hypothetical protein
VINPDQWTDEIAQEISYQEGLLKRGNGADRNVIVALSEQQMLEKFEPPDWLIDGMLQRRFIYAVTGQTGHAKTAIALLLAKLVARGGELAGHNVEQGSVGYLVGENPDDVRMRLMGINSLRDVARVAMTEPDPIYYINGTFDISVHYGEVRAEFGKRGGIDLLIVDTSAAYFCFPDENSNTDIGKHARMLRKLTELPGEPCVLVLCHPVKYVTDVEHLLPRGGGAFLNEMDGNLTVRRLGDAVSTLIELHHNKIRGAGFEPISFRLERITCEKLLDTKGRLIPTVRAMPISRADAETEAGRADDVDDDALCAMLAEPGLTLAQIAQACGWYFPSGEPAISKVQKALERLGNDKLAKKRRRGKWELTEIGKQEARKAAMKREHNSKLSV